MLKIKISRIKPILFVIVFLFVNLFLFLQLSEAQTVYKRDSGFFTPVLESFKLRGGNFISTQKIGPALGYRFNEAIDLSIHTKFLFSETKYKSSNNESISLLNLGATLGHTTDLSKHIMLRSEMSVYHLFLFKTKGIPDFSPSLTSILGSTSFYWQLPTSDVVTFLPNIGGLVGYGAYSDPISTNLTQDYDGMIAGVKLGFDILFKISKKFFLTVKPAYHLKYNLNEKSSVDTFFFHLQFNF